MRNSKLSVKESIEKIRQSPMTYQNAAHHLVAVPMHLSFHRGVANTRSANCKRTNFLVVCSKIGLVEVIDL